jgi:integrase
MARLLVEKQDGTHVEPSRLTTGQYLTAWVEGIAAGGTVRPTTAKTYDVAVRIHIVPRLGRVPIQQLTRKIIREFYAAITVGGRVRGRGGLSIKSVHNVHLTLHRALEDAVDDALLRSNPATRAHRVVPPRHEVRSWSPDELRCFLKAVANNPNFALWRLAAFSGMRRGELLGLRWQDVDFESSMLSVQRQLIRNGPIVAFGEPKTMAGRRTIILDSATVEALRAHQDEQAIVRRALGDRYLADLDLVFCSGNGGPRDPDAVTHQFVRHVRSVGLPRIRFHDLRHTHASIALHASVHPKVVQERLGHSSVKLTLDTYAHVIPPMHRDAAARIASIVDDG